MKFYRTLVSILLIALLLMSCVPITALGGAKATPSNPADSSGTNTKKVVSVLWDNSGSMYSYDDDDDRLKYARYSIQMLMALLNEDDTLIITPMNIPGSSSAVNNVSYGYAVDLTNPDRNAAIDAAFNAIMGKQPSGNTPYESVDIAIKQLTDRGMTTKDKMADENSEYWLFIITDGDLNKPGNKYQTLTPLETQKKFAEFINKYNNFHTVYLGMCVVDLSNPTEPTLKNATNFTGYYSKDPTSVIKTMQSVANQISGRYTLDPSMYTVNGNKVTVHLDRLGFSIRNLSAVLQNSNAVLNTATHNGNPLTIKQSTVIKAGADLQAMGVGNGYSAVVDGGAGLSGGDIVLTFSANVDPNNLSLMVEPALRLRPIIERKDGANWVETDRQYVNATMIPGQELRASYEVYEEGTNRKIELSQVFANIEEKITYDGTTYAPGAPIPLKVGNHDIAISVAVKEGGSTIYTMYASFGCNIALNPTYYRVEGTASAVGGAGTTTYNLAYQIYSDNKQLNQSQLGAYQWAITGKDANGQTIPVNPTVSANGNITAQIDLASYAYGDASFTLRVTDKDGFPRELTLTASHIPDKLFASVLGANSLTASQHGLLSNQDGFTFTANTETGGLNLQNSGYEYRVTVGGKDVTSFCTVDAQGVHFVPNEASVSDLIAQAGDLDVRFSVWVKGYPSISASASATVHVTATLFQVNCEIRGGELKPFSIDEATTRAYVSVLRDGVYLSADELQAMYDNGQLEVEVENRIFVEKILGSFRADYAVVTENGIAYLVMTPADRHFGLLSFFTSMFVFPGDRTVQANCNGAGGSADFHVGGVSAFDYILRIVILYLIGHFICVFGLMKKVKRFSPGYYVSMDMTVGNNHRIQNMDVTDMSGLNLSWKDRIFWKRIILPFNFEQKKSFDYGKIELHATDMMPLVTIHASDEYATGCQPNMQNAIQVCEAIEAAIQNGVFQASDYKGKIFRFDDGEPLFQDYDEPNTDEEELEETEARSFGGDLLPFSSGPICLRKAPNAARNGFVYTFIFFIPEN